MEKNLELSHSGVKGMKWGVRRYQNSDGTLTEEGKRRYGSKEDYDRYVSRNAKKKIKEMSDSELNDRINRLKLENSYKELDPNEASKKKARDFVVDVMTTVGKNTLTNILTQASVHALGVAINKACKVDSTDAAKRIVNPQKGQSDKK